MGGAPRRTALQASFVLRDGAAEGIIAPLKQILVDSENTEAEGLFRVLIGFRCRRAVVRARPPLLPRIGTRRVCCKTLVCLPGVASALPKVPPVRRTRPVLSSAGRQACPFSGRLRLSLHSLLRRLQRQAGPPSKLASQRRCRRFRQDLRKSQLAGADANWDVMVRRGAMAIKLRTAGPPLTLQRSAVQGGDTHPGTGVF
jgi:hypothetical protein